jgi:hypothetical protein
MQILVHQLQQFHQKSYQFFFDQELLHKKILCLEDNIHMLLQIYLSNNLLYFELLYIFLKFSDALSDVP